MSSFKGTQEITLQPNDVISYSFKFTICSAATGNDGFLPYGTTISSVVVTGYNSAGTDVTLDLIDGSPSESSEVVTVTLKHPGTAGRYKLTFVCTLSNGETKEADFTRIRAVDL